MAGAQISVVENAEKCCFWDGPRGVGAAFAGRRGDQLRSVETKIDKSSTRIARHPGSVGSVVSLTNDTDRIARDQRIKKERGKSGGRQRRCGHCGRCLARVVLAPTCLGASLVLIANIGPSNHSKQQYLSPEKHRMIGYWRRPSSNQTFTDSKNRAQVVAATSI